MCEQGSLHTVQEGLTKTSGNCCEKLVEGASKCLTQICLQGNHKSYLLNKLEFMSFKTKLAERLSLSFFPFFLI